eukprot:UN00942
MSTTSQSTYVTGINNNNYQVDSTPTPVKKQNIQQNRWLNLHHVQIATLICSLIWYSVVFFSGFHNGWIDYMSDEAFYPYIFIIYFGFFIIH